MSLGATYTPRPSSLYGRLISALDVEQALAARVTARFGDYLHEVERQHGLELDALPAPRAVLIAPERFPEDQLPAIVVGSPGTADLPAATGQGLYAVRWELVLTIHVAAADGALKLVKLYALALRALAVQQPSPLFMGVDWVNERYRPSNLVGGRSYCTADVTLEVQVPDVTDRHAGPPDDPDWPVDSGLPESPEWPVSQSADAELVKVPIDEPVEEQEP